MNLHRSSKVADWVSVPTVRHNVWQRQAAATRGYVTPGNVLTLTGFLLVLLGLWRVQYGQYLPALVLVGVGRLCDLFDGFIADKSGTKSPLGESLDAGFDKLASLAALGLLCIAHVIPLAVALLILVPNLLIAAVSFAIRLRHVGLHPSRFGKYAMAAAWLGLAAFIAAAWSAYADRFWLGIGYIATGLSFALGMTAALEYYLRNRPALKSARPSVRP